ncbi:hypothetical protein ACHQM5_023044 [Ranunculus cassubicifolius]
MTIGDTEEDGRALSSSYGIKVHHSMCKELINFVDRVTQIFPAIESSQPRCRSGIDALCSLNTALDRASSLIQHCKESSKLYLVVTGDAIKLRCERVRSALGQSLSEIQSMLPLLLAAQVSAIIDDLKDAKFVMESSDEEAGKVLLHLLRHASDSAAGTASEAFQFAASRLQLTSSKALLIEKRSIKKLLDKLRDKDEPKERILKYLLNLVRKYGQSSGGPEPVVSTIMEHDLYPISFGDNGGSTEDEVQNESSDKPTPPDEFRCPISLRLMYDPVVIASGKTFERVWIEDWFREGHDICPITQTKLSHVSVVPNSLMKDLISQWCRKHGQSIPDPSKQPIPAEVYQWKTSSCSIASFGSSLYNVPTRLDDSTVSFRSDFSSVAPDMSMNSFVSRQSSSELSHGIDYKSLSKLGERSWESQCKIMEDVRNLLNYSEDTCDAILTTNFVQTLMKFLKEACDRSDTNAQRLGARVLQIFLTKSRDDVPSFYEDVFYLLISFLDSEIIEEALEIFEVLSKDDCCKLQVVASTALPPILKIVESNNADHQIPAMRILCNLSSQNNIGTHIVRSGYIPNLISLFGHKSLSLHAITILRNLCTTKESMEAIGKTNVLLPRIVELLETGTREEQEHLVGILLSLCSHSGEYCQLVLDAGVISSLMTISINGNAKGKETAKDLINILSDRCIRNQESLSQTESVSDLPCEPISCSMERKVVTKAPGYFRRKLKLFSKPKSVALY